jgi:hypothetical protein
MLKRKKKKKKRGKRGGKGKNSEFSRRWIIFYATSMRPGIATNTFLWPLFLGNVVHPPSFPDFLIECNFYMF